MKRLVVIIQCDLVQRRCSGFHCTKWFYEQQESAISYNSNTRYMTFTCSGCCGMGVAAKLENLSNRLVKKSDIMKDEVAVHLSTCMVNDNHHSDRCPHVDNIKSIIEKHGFHTTVEGTYINKTAAAKREKGIYKSYNIL